MDYIERRVKRLEADYRHCLRDYKRALSRTWILRERLGRLPLAALDGADGISSLSSNLSAVAERAGWLRRRTSEAQGRLKVFDPDEQRRWNTDVDGHCRMLMPDGTRCGKPTVEGSRWCAGHVDLWDECDPWGTPRHRLVAWNPHPIHVGRRIRAPVLPRTGQPEHAARDHRRIEGDFGQGKPIRDGRPLHARGHRTVDDHARRIRGETVRDVIRLGASLAQLAVALFLILAVLGQSATDALPIRDHIEESGTLRPGVTISVVRESDDRTLFSATCDERGHYTLKGDVWSSYYFRFSIPREAK